MDAVARGLAVIRNMTAFSVRVWGQQRNLGEGGGGVTVDVDYWHVAEVREAGVDGRPVFIAAEYFRHCVAIVSVRSPVATVDHDVVGVQRIDEQPLPGVAGQWVHGQQVVDGQAVFDSLKSCFGGHVVISFCNVLLGGGQPMTSRAAGHVTGQRSDAEARLTPSGGAR